jgi:hypothetical protein
MSLRSFLCGALTLFVSAVSAQQLAYFDAAQAYNRLLVEKNNGSYQRVDNYKVIGTSYFFGEKHRADLFAKGEIAYNIFISYNTYNQEVEFYSSANPNQPLVKEAKLVDSFEIKEDMTKSVTENMKFVNGSFIGGDINSFYRLMYAGNRFNLYKKYKSTLGIVTTNYIQSELRQFDLNSEYYYYDHKSMRLEKLKGNFSTIKKELKPLGDVTNITSQDEFTTNPDAALKKIFQTLNN